MMCRYQTPKCGISFNSISVQQKSMKFVPTAIILSVVLATSLLFAQTSIQSVDAVKSGGTKIQQYGKNAQIRVCGTHFCTSDPSLNQQVNPEKNVPTNDDLNALFQRMDVMQKQHQKLIQEKWRLMSNTERVQFLNNLNQALSYMESMDMGEHMNKMMGPYDDKMMDEKGHGKMKHDSDKMRQNPDKEGN